MSIPTESSHIGRDIRQREIVPPEKLAECHALVIGVGAIGRQVALQLAALGMPRMTLYDHDEVAIENLAPQGYWAEDLKSLKVHATAAACRRVNPEIEIMPVPERFRRSTTKELVSHGRLVAFVCVDSIETRQLVWESLHKVASLFLDGRMSAEVIRVLAVEQPDNDAHYATTLFAPEQAYAGSCTAKSTIYTASVAAGLMIGQFTRWLRDMPVDPDVTLNLLSMELASDLQVA
jgi:sulfur carrier protein ThiS adenylyltransferase